MRAKSKRNENNVEEIPLEMDWSRLKKTNE